MLRIKTIVSAIKLNELQTRRLGWEKKGGGNSTGHTDLFNVAGETFVKILHVFLLSLPWVLDRCNAIWRDDGICSRWNATRCSILHGSFPGQCTRTARSTEGRPLYDDVARCNRSAIRHRWRFRAHFRLGCHAVCCRWRFHGNYNRCASSLIIARFHHDLKTAWQRVQV